ncbi:XdhC family protein [Treponema primitia]|uniref:XdhC family protein n=1 Tax=Treponema primitia TaxID=88058 RepID=UPI0002555715|nr:XdhC/CoxI family protein [Treponema primitia]
MAFKELCTLMVQKLSGGEDLILATIIDEDGSSPRSAGARMLVGKGGRLHGTIGGGAVEFKALELALELLEQRKSRRKTYRLRHNDQEDLGMICGGDVDVYFQYIQGEDERTIALLRECLERLDRDENLWLITDLTLLSSWVMTLYGTETPSSVPDLGDSDIKQLTRSMPVLADIKERRIYSEPINFAGKAFIFGGGHVAQALEPILSGVGFRCVVFDSRPEYVTRELFPGAYDLVIGDFGKIGDRIKITPNDYVVIVTHNFDAVVEEQILRNECAYVGLIGSKTKTAALKKQLSQMGFSQEILDKVHAPIGLRIKSETPAEIAISIAAEMILERALRRERD